MNKVAQALGRLAKGKPKTLTKAERKRRSERLAAARVKRWHAKSNARPVRTDGPPRDGGTHEAVVGDSST